MNLLFEKLILNQLKSLLICYIGFDIEKLITNHMGFAYD